MSIEPLLGDDTTADQADSQATDLIVEQTETFAEVVVEPVPVIHVPRERARLVAISAETTPPQPIPDYNQPLLTPDPISQHQEIIQPRNLIIREVVETLLLTILIFWVVNTITGRFRIEGQSMMPTMVTGEYVLINKLAYYLDEPQRGDIIVLHYPRDPSRDFIKRVIGLPGDVVEIEEQVVTVNGIEIYEPYINAPPTYEGTWTVTEDNFFVLGDNRNNSSDSHTWGFLPRELIVGKGWVVYWPRDLMQRVPHYNHPSVSN